MTAVPMHDAAHEIEHDEPVTGIHNRKLAIWTFIGSECLFFASLISVYLVYKGKSLKGPFPKDIFEIPLVTAGTGILLASSFFVVFALDALKANDQKKAKLWLSLTVMCGIFFAAMQVYEFQHFIHKGLTMQGNMFGASFYTLTGFHGTHVALGTLWLGTLLIQLFRGEMSPKNAVNLETAALYWHFVDVVWIVIFPVVYLMN